MTPEQDIRDLIFVNVIGKRYIGQISAQGDGILSGIDRLERACDHLGVQLAQSKKNGARVRPLDIVATLEGSAKQMALAEEELIGWISKASGIATAAWRARKAAGGKIKVVCGAWKKMPLPIKDLLRGAIADGGIQYRIAAPPFLYLDKNYVRILGGVAKTLQSVKTLKGYALVIQLKGEGQGLLREAITAARGGGSILMIDTGRPADIIRIDSRLRQEGIRDSVQLAFGGNIGIADLKELKKLPVEIVDIGQAIVDAPLLDMRLDIVQGRTAETIET